MDILDIDEALKDDSFIFLEDKTHDDVSNILQQWKSNNCQQQLTLQPTSQQQQHTQPEQVYKLNSRTFTRPKKKLAQNLESQFSNISFTNGGPTTQYLQQNGSAKPMLNLEIGGLVTTMHKSFLQDTSPPSSICSSMDASMSIERMNNSLITSADFSNLNFLQSTQSLDLNDVNLGLGLGRGGFNLTDKSMTSDGYTLSDMIRDRKVLESLTMSGDGTLIKDSHIGQIDDISLTLSKTASACSTMDNSTESVEGGGNRTVEFINKDRTYEAQKVHQSDKSDVNHQTLVLSDEMIGDTTFNLVENSMIAPNTKKEENENQCDEPVLNLTHDLCIEKLSAVNETFMKPTVMNETICLPGKGPNTTFDYQSSNTGCLTPESNEKTTAAAAMKFYESTPQATSLRYKKQQYTPSIKMVDDVNISPIVASSSGVHTVNNTHVVVLNDTYEPPLKTIQSPKSSKVNSDTFSGALANFETMEMLDNIENPNETFSRSYQRIEEEQNAAVTGRLEMQNVMDMAQAEAELLAAGNDNDDEEQFEHMLDEFSKVELNPEQLKMKQSLDSIKKRFNYGIGSAERANEREISREAKDMRELMRTSAEFLGEQTYSNDTMELRHQDNDHEQLKLKQSPIRCEIQKMKASPLKESTQSDLLKNSMLNSNNFMRDSSVSRLTSSTMSAASSNGSERLLSRRSRLYDDFNLSTFSAQSAKHASSTQKLEEGSVTETETKGASDYCEVGKKTEEADERPGVSMDNAAEAFKLAEKRERDRDRFKTIKIIKQRFAKSEENEIANVTELNVPCIDDDDDFNNEQVENAPRTDKEPSPLHAAPLRYSRRDRTSASPTSNVFNNNKSEVQEEVNDESITTKINTNYLTYKKPKDKPLMKRNLPEVFPSTNATVEETTTTTSTLKSRLEPRSLSRPRYISGLQKFSVVSKATSAGDLEKTMHSALAASTNRNVATTVSGGYKSNASGVSNPVNFNRTQPIVGATKVSSDLKSPMGIKSKSFHNLSSNFGYPSAAGSGGLQAPKTTAFGLKKLNNGIGSVTEKQSKINSMRLNKTTTSASTSIGTNTAVIQTTTATQQTNNDESVFKVPKLVSGIRVPAGGAAAGLKRAGLMRPSSGYYSLNVTTKGVLGQTTEADSDAGRHSPTESMSSASSRSSIHSIGNGMKSAPSNSPTVGELTLPTTLTKITTGSSGLPKPSGLRPPSNIKRSGLPRPASIVRR